MAFNSALNKPIHPSQNIAYSLSSYSTTIQWFHTCTFQIKHQNSKSVHFINTVQAIGTRRVRTTANHLFYKSIFNKLMDLRC